MNAFFAVSWPASDVLLERLGWVLVHSLWQFAVLGLVTVIGLRLLRRSSATARHGWLVCALGAAVAIPAATWSIHLLDRSLVPESAAPGELSENNQASAATTSDDIALGQFTRTADATGHRPGGATAGPVEATFRSRVVHVLEPWFPWIVGSWCAGVVLCSMRPLIGWRTLRRLRTTGTSEPSRDVREARDRVSRRLGLSVTVEVVSSSLAKGPLLIGYFRPVVLLPVSLATSIPVSQLEAILAHELAHVRRHDFLVNLLQTLVETLFFYHPVVWWLSHRLRIEREHCCDDLVVRRLNNRAEYGRALIAIEQLQGRTTSLALGATDGSLLARVRRIVGVTGEREVRWLDRWQGASLSLVSLGVVTLFALTWTAAAQDKADDVAGPFIATLPGDLEVELIGVGFHPSSSENSEGKDWWQPNGRLLPQRPQLSDGEFTVGGNTEARSRSREFLFQIRGLPQDHSVRTDYGGVRAATGSVFQEGVWIGHHGAGPFERADTKIRIGIATGPFGPAMGIDIRGKKDNAMRVPPDLKVFYDRVIPVGVTETVRETVLLLDNRPYDELYDLAAWEIYAVDQAGVQHRRRSESVPPSGPRELTFALPISELRRFEYRLRPYRHWAVFDRVSLEPGRTLNVKISVESLISRGDGRPADRTALPQADASPEGKADQRFHLDAPAADEPMVLTKTVEKSTPETAKTSLHSESATGAERSSVHFSVVVAAQALLLDGTSITTWEEIERKIADLDDPSRAYPHFYITAGARKAGKTEAAKKQIWELHKKYNLRGHSEGSLWPRTDLRYDRIQTAADLKPDASLRKTGTVVADGKPVSGAEIVLVTPIDPSISYQTYEVTLVEGRLRNRLEHVMTITDESGKFAIYPPQDTPYYVLAVHPEAGFALVRDEEEQFTNNGDVRLNAWAGLVVGLDDPKLEQQVNLTTSIRASGGRPEISINQYGSELRRANGTDEFHYAQIPPFYQTTLSRSLPNPPGGTVSTSAATVSLLPGETRQLHLGAITPQQLNSIERLRSSLRPAPRSELEAKTPEE